MGQTENELLLVLASAVSVELARGRSAGDVEKLAAFFTILGDDLALLALDAPAGNPVQTGRGGTLPA